MTRMRWVAAGVLVALAAWLAFRPTDDQDWVVRGGTDNPSGAVKDCTDISGVDLQNSSFYANADAPVPPGEPSGGVAMRVDTKADADAMSACLADGGVTDLTVELTEDGPSKSFTKTGP